MPRCQTGTEWVNGFPAAARVATPCRTKVANLCGSRKIFEVEFFVASWNDRITSSVSNTKENNAKQTRTKQVYKVPERLLTNGSAAGSNANKASNTPISRKTPMANCVNRNRCNKWRGMSPGNLLRSLRKPLKSTAKPTAGTNPKKE